MSQASETSKESKKVLKNTNLDMNKTFYAQSVIKNRIKIAQINRKMNQTGKIKPEDKYRNSNSVPEIGKMEEVRMEIFGQPKRGSIPFSRTSY